MNKRIVKLIVGIVAGVALVFLISIPVCSLLQINRWIRTDKISLSTFPFDLGLQYSTFALDGPEGKLYGWVIPAQEREQAEEASYSDRTVVFSHNYDSNREMNDLDGLYYIRDLVEHGYNVVTFDYSGCGYSDGDVNVFSLEKSEELRMVITYAQQTTGAGFLAVQGVGFGCTPALEAVAADKNVDALILDSCYGDFEEWFLSHYDDWSGYTYAPYRPVILGLFPKVSGVAVWDISPRQTMAEISGRHILLIQGEQDQVFGTEDVQQMYGIARQNNQAELWLVPGTSHLRAYSSYTEDYVRRVTDFLEKAEETQ